MMLFQPPLKLVRTLTLFCCFVGFSGTQLAHSQTIEDAIDANAVGLVNIAAKFALEIYTDDPSDLLALELYCQYASASGNVTEALPYSEMLFLETLHPKHAARHVKRLAFAGELAEARQWANWVQANSIHYRDDVDCALSRDYTIDFEFRPKVLNDQGIQADLAPFFHVPVPIANRRWQTSSFRVTGASGFSEVGSNDTRFLQVNPAVDSKNRLRNFYVDCEVSLSPLDCRQLCSAARWGYPVELQPYLERTDSINFDHESVEDLAISLRRYSPFATVDAVCNYGSQNIFYVPRGFNGNGSASEILAKGYGHCASRTALMVALLRQNGIPARALRGHSMMTGDGRSLGISRLHHSILEFYLDGAGWVPWDFNQTPGVVIPNFLALWAYQKSISDSEPLEPTYSLNWIQRLGLPGFSGYYNYAPFQLVRRHW